MLLRRTNTVFVIVAGVVLLAALAACWIIPYRLATTGARSFYAFAFIGDEGCYAARVQPLLDGASATNPVNGVCDPKLISMFYLEDLLRASLTVSGVDVTTFVWGWRYVLPVALLGLMALLACAALRRRHRVWSLPLCYATAAAGFVLLYAGHEMLISFPPLQGWLNRFPTNIEFPLSVAVAWAFVRFINVPSVRRGAVLALASAACVYLRFYAALPWAVAIPFAMVWQVRARRVPVKAALATLGVLLLAIAPWIGIMLWNNQLQTQHELVARYFRPVPYGVNPNWGLYMVMAALFSGGALLVEKPHRPLLYGGAVSLVFLTLASRCFFFAPELLYDRFGMFYLVVLAAMGMLILRRRCQSWRGKGGMRVARRWTLVLGGAALAVSGWLAAGNWKYDVAKYPLGPYASVAEELEFLPAYRWIREHTPESALFLFDDGHDWSEGKLPTDERALANLLAQGDLFQIVARRRRALSERLLGNGLSDKDLDALNILQRGAFGFPCRGNEYANAVKRFRPSHIFLRKTHSAELGLLPRFKALGRTIYGDAVCEVWEVRYDGSAGRPPPKPSP